MNDFRQIKFDGKLLQVEEFNRMHDTCMGFIRKSVEESTDDHIVVVTHHLPTFEVVAPQRNSVLNSAFASEYGDWIANSRIDAWIYGHSHTNTDYPLIYSLLSLLAEILCYSCKQDYHFITSINSFANQA